MYVPPYIPPIRPAVYQPPSRRLYSPPMVLLASFFGFPLAGFLLIGANYRALGRPGAAWTAWICGLVGMILLAIVAYVLRTSVPVPAIGGVAVLGTYGIAARLQGPTYESHLAAGGLPAPGWKIAATVLATLSLYFAFLAITSWLVKVTDVGPIAKVTVGGRITVNGDEGVAEAEARQTGEALMTVPWYAARTRECGVERNGTGHALSFIMKPGSWDMPSNIEKCREVLRALNRRAANLGPWVVRLRDEDFKVHRTISDP